MLARKDKKRLPVGFIPNGSGNDICYNLDIRDIEQAIDIIIKGQIIKTDLVKALLDHDSESDILL